MSLNANDITIAITVFNRRQFLKQAIDSALNQTLPCRVIVVEDCGPDAEMEAFVKKEFGSRVDYFRNPHRRGLFDNWNACLEYCQTPWLSILHDDDFLAPVFVEAMLDLSRQAPGCGLYFGETPMLNDAGETIPCGERPALSVPWKKVDLANTITITPFPFPGHIFEVAAVRGEGGFNQASQYCGDWEMWSKLIAHHSAAQTNVVVGYNRSHGGLERGTSKIFRNGRLRPLTFVQQKRIIHLLREQGSPLRFDRNEFLKQAPMSVDYLVRHGARLTPRLLRYNVGLLQRSTSPSFQHALFRSVARVLGTPFVETVSRLFCGLQSKKERGL